MQLRSSLAVAPILPLAWELPYVAGVAEKKKKKKGHIVPILQKRISGERDDLPKVTYQQSDNYVTHPGFLPRAFLPPQYCGIAGERKDRVRGTESLQHGSHQI